MIGSLRWTTIRLYPDDYSTARTQLYERTAEILSVKSDAGIHFQYWTDWTLLPDPLVQKMM